MATFAPAFDPWALTYTQWADRLAQIRAALEAQEDSQERITLLELIDQRGWNGVIAAIRNGEFKIVGGDIDNLRKKADV